jgi:hypothetical protein
MATFKISGLTALTSVSATNLLEVSEVSASGYRSRKATAAQLRSYVLDAISGYSLAKTSLANVSATTTLDLATSNYFAAQVSGSATFVFANSPGNTVAAGLILELTNGGDYTVTWPASVDWPGGTAPTLTSSGVDVLVFITDDGGTIWRGVRSMADSK